MSKWINTEVGRFSNDWKILTIEDVVSPQKKSLISGPFGSNISAKYFVDDGIPVIRGNNLSLSIIKKFNDENFVFISESKAHELNTWAKKNDIILTAVGTIGQVGFLTGKERYPRYIISNKQLRLRVNEDLIVPLFAYYWLASPLMSDIIIQRNTGSSVPLINLSVVKSLLIPAPPLPEQKSIVSVLSSLDDKIDLLHRQNTTLEALAETLFRQWFVEEAKEEWDIITLGELVLISSGKSLKREFFLEIGKYPILGANGEIGKTDKFNTEGKFLYTGRVGTLGNIFRNVSEKVWLSDNTLIIRPYNYFNFIYFILKNANLEDYNVGSTQPLIRQSDLKNIELVVPPDKALIEFEVLTEVLFDKINFNKSRINNLTSLRDALLPKLMSGEVRVALDPQPEPAASP